MEKAPGSVWIMHGSRIFIVGKAGSKYLTGLVFEADGWHQATVPLGEPLRQACYHGKDYPARRMRGFLRRAPAATKGAAKIRRKLLASAA